MNVLRRRILVVVYFIIFLQLLFNGYNRQRRREQEELLLVEQTNATSQRSAMTSIPARKNSGRKNASSSDQQALFTQVLDTINKSQRNISDTQWVIIYQPNGESGLANVFIGLVSCIIAALSTGRGVQMTPFHMFDDYFYDPFPLFHYNNSFQGKDVQFFFMYSLLAQGRALKRNHLNQLTKKRALLIDCFTDVTPHFLNNNAYRATLTDLHLWSQSSPFLPNVVDLLFEYTMRPKQPLCTLINKYIRSLRQRVFIGVQVRLGGKSLFYSDKEFLQMDDLAQFGDAIASYMSDRKLSNSDVFVFLSTDNQRVVSFFQQRFGSSLRMVKEYAIGHSAPNKNRFEFQKAPDYTKRAIMDLLILQRADFLVVTEGSTFGKLATRLQRNRNSTVVVDKAIDWSSRPDHCSVFERSDRPYLAQVISPSVKQLP